MLGLAIGGLAFAVLVSLAIAALVDGLTDRISPDRYAWARFVASGGSFRETRR